MNAHKPQRQTFVYHVCRKDIEEEPFDELVQIFWKIEAEGTLPEQNKDSSLDQLAVHTMENSICHYGEGYQIRLPWKPVKKIQNNYFSAFSQLKNLQNDYKTIPVSIRSTTRHSEQTWIKILSIQSKCKRHFQSPYGAYFIIQSLIQTNPEK